MTTRMGPKRRHPINNNCFCSRFLVRVVAVQIIIAILISGCCSPPSSSSSSSTTFTCYAAANSSSSSYATNNNNYHDPYTVLGVPRTANEQDIKKAYRTLILRYHPDKNVQKSMNEKQLSERKFKQIQSAYEQIGSPESRRRYQRYGSSSSSGGGMGNMGGTGNGRNPYGDDPLAQAFFRGFQSGGFGSSSNSPLANAFFRGFQSGGFGSRSNSNSGGSRSFSWGGPGIFATRFAAPPPFGRGSNGMPSSFANNNSNNAAELPLKSIYIQKVQVSLEDLYNGVAKYNFTVKDTLLARYRAAIRGKVIFLSLYQGLAYSLPVLRISKILAVIVGLYMFHTTIPRLDPNNNNNTTITFSGTIPKGTKGGKGKGKQQHQHRKSIIRFATTNDVIEVVFHIEEAKHPTFRRINDNDLETKVTITAKEAKYGCTKTIKTLLTTDNPTTTTTPTNSNHNNDNHNKRSSTIKITIPANVYSYKKERRKRKQQQKQKQHQTKHSSKSFSSSSSDTNHTPSSSSFSYDNIIQISGEGWPVRNKKKNNTASSSSAYTYGDLLVKIKVLKGTKSNNKMYWWDPIWYKLIDQLHRRI